MQLSQRQERIGEGGRDNRWMDGGIESWIDGWPGKVVRSGWLEGGREEEGRERERVPSIARKANKGVSLTQASISLELS